MNKHGKRKTKHLDKKIEKDHAVLRGITLTGVSEISANSAGLHKCLVSWYQ